MSNAVSLELIQTFKEKANSDKTTKLTRNAAVRNNVTELAMD